jgi:hypothetical protein
MAVFRDRTGDFTKKKYLYKFYKNGYTSRRPKYITEGQYLAVTGTLLEGGYMNSGVFGGGSDSANGGLNIFFQGAGSNAFAQGPYKVETDMRRKIDIKNIDISFGHGSANDMYASLPDYTITLFDYTIKRDLVANTIAISYKGTQLASATYTAAYYYLRLHEQNGILYIQRSADRQTWTAWTQQTIDFSADMLRSTLSLMMNFSMSGPSVVTAFMESLEATDKKNQLLSIETKALSDLEFTETINTPASSTTLTLPYSPLDVPEHCDIGNFVEAYVNFYDDGAIRNEPILDQNSDPIQDQNGDPIYGVVIHGNVPERASILKFSGYISSIDYDYDNETITLNLVSHGETASNSVVRGDIVQVPVLSQLLENANVASGNSRQTFRLAKMTRVDVVALIVAYSGGGSSTLTIGTGNTVIATSNTFVWSGGIGKGALNYRFENPVYLEAGVTYWLKLEGMPINWYYQNTNVYSNGTRQAFVDGAWENAAGDVYMVLSSSQRQLNLQISGDSQSVAADIFGKSLDLDYSPLYLEEVEDAEYDINIGLNIDSAKNAINALYRQLPSGWFYSVDIGTSAVKIKNRNANPDHLFVFGRDFTEMKVTKDIDGIINDVYYIGGELVEQGAKLTTRSFDVESISEYRQGLAIISNDKVTRYDTAALLSQNTISNNNEPRITTEITLSAARYNIETVQKGDVVKIVNGDRDVLRTTLVVAEIGYSPNSITISLDSAPRNLSRTIDAIQRDLQNKETAGAAGVV